MHIPLLLLQWSEVPQGFATLAIGSGPRIENEAMLALQGPRSWLR